MPLLDISPQTYNTFVTMILNGTKKSNPSYNPYANTNSFLFAAVFASSFLKQYYAGIMPSIIGKDERELLSGIALYEAGVFGALRAELNARVNLTVPPFNFTVGNLTNLSAQLANRLAGCGVKDEGLIVPLQLGAENRTSSNIVPGNANSLAYARSAREILRIVFTTGNATRSGGIFPRGLNGALYRRILTLKLS
ncbi:desiccation-related protein PCC13-62 [Gossypium hirsutum]|nr:desiccation-related protein PCC13-62-like [Gossypium hirsutum]